MKKWEELADENKLKMTIQALNKNNIETMIVNDKEEALQKILEIIPQKSQVITMSSITLEQTGVTKEINSSGKFISLKNLLNNTQDEREMKKIGAAAFFAIGSVHAVTEEGTLLIASASGSQIPAYSFSAKNVIFIVSTKKIVKDMDEGMKRIYEHVFPLEDKRAMSAYGAHSGVNKILIINKEMFAGRIKLIFVEEDIGF